MYPKRPASSSACLTASPSNASTFFLPKSVEVCTASAFTFTQSTFRRSPLSMAVTSPLTGEANFTSGQALFTNKASPALTWSPSRTTTLGVTPTKAAGTSAYSLACTTGMATSLEALPVRLMSKPLRNLITFAITTLKILYLKLIFWFYFVKTFKLCCKNSKKK